MLNIGALSQRGQLLTVSYTTLTDGYRKKTLTPTVDFFYKKVNKRTLVEDKSQSIVGQSEIELIVRYSEDIKLNSILNLYEYNNRGAQQYWKITSIEEIGRAQGLKINCKRQKDLSGI